MPNAVTENRGNLFLKLSGNPLNACQFDSDITFDGVYWMGKILDCIMPSNQSTVFDMCLYFSSVYI